LAEDQTRSAARDDHRIRRKCFQIERAQIHRHQAATDLMIVEHQRHHLPAFVLRYFASHFMTAHLFIERVEKLLASRSSSESRTVMFGAAETTEVEQAFIRARKRNAHAIEQIN